MKESIHHFSIYIVSVCRSAMYLSMADHDAGIKGHLGDDDIVGVKAIHVDGSSDAVLEGLHHIARELVFRPVSEVGTIDFIIGQN